MFREATLDDVEVLAWFRVAMMRDSGFLTDEAVAPDLYRATEEYCRRHMPTGEFRSWLAELGGRPIGCAGLLIMVKPPGPRDLTGREAYVMNVYTVPEHRRKGLATALMERILAWCSEQGIRRTSLHASEAGKAVYERMGFGPRDGEMVRWELRE